MIKSAYLVLLFVTVILGPRSTSPALAQEPISPHAELGTDTPVLVPSGWLAEHLTDPDVAILDARPDIRDYLKGHIMGAQRLGFENLTSSAGGVPARILEIDMIERTIGRLGIRQYTHVVVYGRRSDDHAAFVACVLRNSGLQRVSILDGGVEGWLEQDRVLVSAVERVEETWVHFTPKVTAIAAWDEVRSASETGGAILLDARPAAQFRAGHIPGARNRPWEHDLIGPGQEGAGCLRSVEELKPEYEKLGIDGGKPVIVYCGAGLAAAVPYLNLRHRIGIPDVKLYDGSWCEWASAPDAPKETGE